MQQTITPSQLFDGARLMSNVTVTLADGMIQAITPATGKVTHPGTLAPGFVDLQVNGGGGILLDGSATVDSLAQICTTHLRLGCAGILPTLITDTPAATSHVINVAIKAAQAKMPGFLGLHLEGPHLDPRRKGAHDTALIRPMTQADLNHLLAAARDLPALLVTVAPGATTPAQISALAKAGIIVSLGHTDCTYAEAQAAIAAGASCATHLFNAMSQLTSREPGLVGAVLSGNIAAGIIADGHHIDPATLRIALAARPSGLFLVSDCMAFAGSDLTEITLGGRTIFRENGRLTLADGTLAGADLRLDDALRLMIEAVGLTAEQALAMATSTPAALIGQAASCGHIAPGRQADLVLLGTDWALQKIWHRGADLTPANRPRK